MSFKYKNISKFYKHITISGKRVNLPPNGVIESDRELELEIYDFLEIVDNNVKVTVIPREDKKKVEIVGPDQYKKLEQAIIKLYEQIPTLVKQTLEETPTIEKEEMETLAIELKKLKESLSENPNANLAEKINSLEKYLRDTIDKRQHVLKDAIDDVNNAVVNLEKFVYEGDWDNLPLVVIDDTKEEPKEDPKKEDTGISIEDILKGN